jgi:hypothetical protein
VSSAVVTQSTSVDDNHVVVFTFPTASSTTQPTETAAEIVAACALLSPTDMIATTAEGVRECGLDAAAVFAKLSAFALGRVLVVGRRLSSTQTLMLRYCDALPPGTAMVAVQQYAGKVCGRMHAEVSVMSRRFAFVSAMSRLGVQEESLVMMMMMIRIDFGDESPRFR